MDQRPLGNTGLRVSALGYGAFKIGRNRGVKYPAGYELPDDAACDHLLNGLVDLGVTYIDTAPAYGLSEERIGRALHRRRRELVLSSKVGETFEEGRSTYDFSADAIERSITRTLRRLRTEVIDVLFVHSDGRDLEIQDGDAVPCLQGLRQRGLVRAIGFSGKTVPGAEAALAWADAIMVEYHLDDRSHEPVLARAAELGVGVVVKKALASGHLDPAEALRFVLARAEVASAVVGTLSLDHMRRNIQAVAGRSSDGASP